MQKVMTELDNKVLVRKNIVNLTAQELADYRKAVREVMSLSDNRGYAHFAGIHGWPQLYCWHHEKNFHDKRALRLFLPWHRAYLYEFEKALQDRVTDVTIPYWDWRFTRNISKAFSDKTVDGKPNPLYKFHMKFDAPNGQHIDRDTERSPWDNGEGLPTEAQVDEVLNIEDNDDHFDEFTDEIEEVHDQVHGWVGGAMGVVPFAAYDPIFWSHHSFIDKLWWDWQKKSGISEMPDSYKDLPLAPFGLTVKDVIEVYDLGYEYAGISTDVEGNWGQQ